MARPVASWDSALIFCRSSCDNSVIALSGYKMPAMTSALRSLAAAPKPPAKAELPCSSASYSMRLLSYP
ncbi:hypothetical protein A9G45_08520 [Gilliamella sp. HK2]|uniref:hypothetical protein n=1 Tax=unclassified Gilliamella TaxID=2685620 RepID=UPI00080EB3C1|nr:hypothetical protein [Gilliamella apicola]OCG24612.1 hypothetical protein A9G46_08430 [Gilliamella apicola]OCG27404.1 hypothetical protein A9G45_08520 [Gilliamella apicola]